MKDVAELKTETSYFQNSISNKLYIQLLKNVLTDYHRLELGEYAPLRLSGSKWKVVSGLDTILASLNRILNKKKIAICRNTGFSQDNRAEGKDWPSYAETMIGLKRLENIEFCIKEIIENNIPGDLIETGVWRGGATIFMKALLAVNGIENRIVWVADSFEGLPKPDGEKYPDDKNDALYKCEQLAVSLETVKHNFEKYGLLDSNIKFLKGWFKETLPSAPIDKLALLRLDGDMYESTMEGLVNLYPKLSKGGYIIIDDWGAMESCRLAVEDFREKYYITEKIHKIDWTGVFWKKEK